MSSSLFPGGKTREGALIKQVVWRIMSLSLETQTRCGAGPGKSSVPGPGGNYRTVVARRPTPPPKTCDLNPLTYVLRPQTRCLLGTGTKTKIKREMNT